MQEGSRSKELERGFFQMSSRVTILRIVGLWIIFVTIRNTICHVLVAIRTVELDPLVARK